MLSSKIFRFFFTPISYVYSASSGSPGSMMLLVPGCGNNHHRPHHSRHPSTGAELLADLHRRLQLQSINNGAVLPARPSTLVRKHRRSHLGTRRSSSGHHRRHKVPSSAPLLQPPADMPDLLLPSSAFNHPSRHTQYHVVSVPDSTPCYVPPTSDYSTSSPSSNNSGSPPLPLSVVVAPPVFKAPSTAGCGTVRHYPLSASTPVCSTSQLPPPQLYQLPQPPPAAQLPLSIPSPPLQRAGAVQHRRQRLTSTLLTSPPASSSGGSSGCPTATTHPTSPASPELSGMEESFRESGRNSFLINSVFIRTRP
jgi:hypothetical protein